MLGLGLSITRGGVAPFSPASIFANSEEGIWLDPSDLSTLFTDTAGTTPVTTPGQTVALALDKSQGLVLGPELVAPIDLTSGWVFSGGPVSFDTSNTFTADAVANVHRDYFTIGKFYEIDITVTFTSAGLVLYNQFNASNTIHNFGGPGTKTFHGIYQAITAVFNLRPTAAGSVVIDNISVRELPGYHATQATAAARPTYQVTSGVANLVDDGVDDVLNWTAPADDYTVAYVNTSGTVTILTSQALSGATDILQVSPLVGYLAVNRALTTAEAASLTAYFEALAA